MKKKIALILLAILVLSIALTACTSKVYGSLRDSIDDSFDKEISGDFVSLVIGGETTIGYYKNEKNNVMLKCGEDSICRVSIILEDGDSFRWSLTYTGSTKPFTMTGSLEKKSLTENTEKLNEDNIVMGSVTYEMKTLLREFAATATRLMLLELKSYMKNCGMGDMVDDLGFTNLL